MTLRLNTTILYLSLKFGRHFVEKCTVKLPHLLKNNNKNWTERVNPANTARWHPRSACPKILQGVGMWHFKVTEGHGAGEVGRSRGRGARLADPICCGGNAGRGTAPWDVCLGVGWETKAKTVCLHP